MSTILVLGPLGAGHINPLLGIAEELVRRGHDVTFAAPRPFSARIEETGATFLPVTSAWEGSDRDGPPQMHGREFIEAVELLLEETKGMVDQLMDRSPPDIVVHDAALAWWGRILAHRWGVPNVETWPNFVGNKHWNMQRYTKISLLSLRFIRTVLRLRKYLSTHGIRDVGAFTQGALSTDRLVTVPRVFQPAGDTFEGFHFVGPTLTERRFQGQWTRPADVDGSEKRVLLVSLGTAYNHRPDFFRMIAHSGRGRPWHIVMSTGDAIDASVLGDLPDNVEAHSQVPQLDVLAQATVFVTHAGMGSALESIDAEVPMLAVPQMAEQRANADRIVELGLGAQLDAGHDSGGRMTTESVDVEEFWRIVESLAEDRSIRSRLARMHDQSSAAGGSRAAADVVEAALHH